MRIIKFEYGFRSVNGIVKKVYALSQIPNIEKICDVWNILPIVYVRQFTGLQDKNGVDIYVGDLIAHKFYSTPVEVSYKNGSFCAEDVSLLSDSVEVIGNIHEK
jgi:hypothetical protein